MLNKPLYTDLLIQKIILERRFPNIYLEINDGSLSGIFCLKNRNWKKRYSFYFNYKGESYFKIYITKPLIKPNLDIHMFLDRSLCLYFFNDFPYNHKLLIARDIIPKCTDWINNYELWIVNGNRWLSPFKPHGEHQLYLPYLKRVA